MTKFVDSCARIMVSDRPDLWTLGTARRAAARWVNTLAEHPGVSETGAGGFAMLRRDGEYALVRNLLDGDDNGSVTFDWTIHSWLFGQQTH